MPPSNRGSGTNPFLQPKRQAKPSTAAKQAAVFAAEQNLKPWELPQGRGKPKQAKPAPLDTRYKAAVAAPVNAPVKVGNKKVPARQYLAGTETPRRRAQYEQIIAPPVPRPDRSFLHALLATPTSVYQHGVEPVLHAAGYTAKQATGQGTYRDRPFLEDLGIPAKAFVGNALTNAVTHGQTSHLGAAGLEAAALFPPFKGLRALKFLRKAEEATTGAKAVEETAAASHVGQEATKGRFFNQHGDLFPVKFAENDNTAVHNIHDEHGNLVGSMVYDARPHQKSVYVESVFIRPEFRNVENFNRLVEPLAGETRPIEADFENPRLQKVFERLSSRGKIEGKVLPPRGEQVIERGTAPSKLPPLVKGEPVQPLTAAPAAAKTPGQQLVSGLPEAKRIVREEKGLRSKELGMRTREAQRRLEAGGYTEEARKHASEALSGEMPTLRWDRFTEMTPETLDDMVHHIETHPAFQGSGSVAFFKRKNTVDALSRIMGGYHPRDFEIKLLREAFGDVTTKDLVDSVGFWKKNGNRVLDVIGIPRSLLSSFDLSAPLRQNLVFATSHPILWGKNFKPMIKAFGSTAVQDQIVRQIASDPNFDLMKRADLRFTDLGHDILKREEGFQSNYAETITGGKVSPVRASNRAYVTFNNKSRADLFNFLLEKVEKLHPELDWQSREGDKMLKEMGRLVNNATGRGRFPVKALEKSMPILNATLFSPRLLASRLDVLSYPASVWTMNSVTRNEALKQLGALTGAVTGVVGLAALAGAKITHDPRNADFGKVRVGNTRFDVAGGFLQPIRLAAQLGPTRLGGGKIISSTTGKSLSLTDRKFGGANRLGIFLRFLESKESPPVGFIVNWSRGTDFAGKPFSVQSEAYNRLVPLLVQDAKQAYDSGDSNTGGVALAMAIYGIGMWGIGTQTYGPKQPKPKASKDPFATPGTNPFLSSSSGSSNPFLSP